MFPQAAAMSCLANPFEITPLRLIGSSQENNLWATGPWIHAMMGLNWDGIGMMMAVSEWWWQYRADSGLMMAVSGWFWPGSDPLWHADHSHSVLLLFSNEILYFWHMNVSTYWGRDKMAAILQMAFSHALSWISLKFVCKGPINNISTLVQIMACRLSGDKPLSEPMMVSLYKRHSA